MVGSGTDAAMTDLLLQVFFHYAKVGSVLHDRAFVTLFVGGFLVRDRTYQTLPLLISKTPKRSLIQIQSWTVVVCYPVIIAIMYARMGRWLPSLPSPAEAPVADVYTWPWASTAMVPLLVLSASPAQILAHNRSLRRKGAYVSNVRTFYMAQCCQSLLALLLIYVVGVDIGMVGSEELHGGLHANFFSALPIDDNMVNAARVLYAVLLAAHLCLCLASARSSWSRLLNAMNIQPWRTTRPSQRDAPSDASPVHAPTSWRVSDLQLPLVHAPPGAEDRAWRQFRNVRSVLSGLVLWSITALAAFFSGVGGVFRRGEKVGEELRFLRSMEVIGVGGAVVGFIMPAIIWLVLFRIRRPRAILLSQSQSMRRRMSRYLLSPLTALVPSTQSAEREPLLPASEPEAQIPTHENEETPTTRDEATFILLARKERELQQRTRLYVRDTHQAPHVPRVHRCRCPAPLWPFPGDLVLDRACPRRVLVGAHTSRPCTRVISVATPTRCR